MGIGHRGGHVADDVAVGLGFGDDHQLFRAVLIDGDRHLDLRPVTSDVNGDFLASDFRARVASAQASGELPELENAADAADATPGIMLPADVADASPHLPPRNT